MGTVWDLVLVTVVALLASADWGNFGGADAARILGIFPSPSFSHQLPCQALMKALAARGHQVTVISTDPLKEPVENYIDVDMSFSYSLKEKFFKFTDWSQNSDPTFVFAILQFMAEVIDAQITSPQMEDFLRINKNKTFDLVFVEWNSYYSYIPMTHAFGSPPVIGIISLGGVDWSYQDMGNPNNPASLPDVQVGFSDKMSFWQRLISAATYLQFKSHMEWSVKPRQEMLMRKHFGDATSSVNEMAYNMSLLILNNHWITDYPRPLLPNVIQIAGIHVQDNPSPLTDDLKLWMDDAKESGGLIYFSLGSNVLSKDLSISQRTAVMRAFARLPHRVFWKWEEDDLPGCPDNVRVSKWLQQQAVLAHPSVRLFITQGGLQSLHEAVYHSVPVLVIPVFGDQKYNAERILSAGVGQRIEFTDITEEKLHSKILSMLHDEGYKKRMSQLSSLFREQRAPSLENALWWVEYVLRHKGAPHLRSAALHLSWYQYLLLDVVAFAIIMGVILILCLYAMRSRIWVIFKRNNH